MSAVPGFDHLIRPDGAWDGFRCAADRLRDGCGSAGAPATFGPSASRANLDAEHDRNLK
jgi:hypothetical protein